MVWEIGPGAAALPAQRQRDRQALAAVHPVRRGMGQAQAIAGGEHVLVAHRSQLRTPLEPLGAFAQMGLAPGEIEKGRGGGIGGKHAVAPDLQQQHVGGVEVERGAQVGPGDEGARAQRLHRAGGARDHRLKFAHQSQHQRAIAGQAHQIAQHHAAPSRPP